MKLKIVCRCSLFPS